MQTLYIERLSIHLLQTAGRGDEDLKIKRILAEKISVFMWHNECCSSNIEGLCRKYKCLSLTIKGETATSTAKRDLTIWLQNTLKKHII